MADGYRGDGRAWRRPHDIGTVSNQCADRNDECASGQRVDAAHHGECHSSFSAEGICRRALDARLRHRCDLSGACSSSGDGHEPKQFSDALPASVAGRALAAGTRIAHQPPNDVAGSPMMQTPAPKASTRRVCVFRDPSTTIARQCRHRHCESRCIARRAFERTASAHLSRQWLSCGAPGSSAAAVLHRVRRAVHHPGDDVARREAIPDQASLIASQLRTDGLCVAAALHGRPGRCAQRRLRRTGERRLRCVARDRVDARRANDNRRCCRTNTARCSYRARRSRKSISTAL